MKFCNGTYSYDGRVFTCNQQCGCGAINCPVHDTSLHGAVQAVTDFHNAMGQPVHQKLHTPDDDRVRLRAKLILEECKETIDSMFLPSEVNKWDDIEKRDVGIDHVALADGLADLIYVAIGAANEFGIPLAKVWAEVHRSNMAKIGPNGEVVKRADGKVIKPEGWTPPDIEGCLK